MQRSEIRGRRKAEALVGYAATVAPSRALPDSAKLHPGYLVSWPLPSPAIAAVSAPLMTAFPAITFLVGLSALAANPWWIVPEQFTQHMDLLIVELQIWKILGWRPAKVSINRVWKRC